MKVGTKIAAMAAGTLVIMLIVGGTSFYSVTRMLDTFRWVDHTELVLDKLQAVFDQVIEAQSATRAFIVLNDSEQLATVSDAQEECKKTLSELRQLTVDNPAQQKRIDWLEPLSMAALREMRRHSETFKQEGYD